MAKPLRAITTLETLSRRLGKRIREVEGSINTYSFRMDKSAEGERAGFVRIIEALSKERERLIRELDEAREELYGHKRS